MERVRITIGEYVFTAKLETEKAPKTCEQFKKMLPYKDKTVHVRWCGEGIWIPMGEFDVGVGYENATSYPNKGEIVIQTGKISETENMIPYGANIFFSKVGRLVGNHFLTIEDDLDKLAEVGVRVLYEGAKDITFELID